MDSVTPKMTQDLTLSQHSLANYGSKSKSNINLKK